MIKCPCCDKKARVLYTHHVKAENIKPGGLMALLYCECSDIVECGATFTMERTFVRFTKATKKRLIMKG